MNSNRRLFLTCGRMGARQSDSILPMTTNNIACGLWLLPDLEALARRLGEKFASQSAECEALLRQDQASEVPGSEGARRQLSWLKSRTSCSIVELERAAVGKPLPAQWLFDGTEALAWAWMELSPLERMLAEGLDPLSLTTWLHGSFDPLVGGFKQIPLPRAWFGSEIFARQRASQWAGLRRLMRAKMFGQLPGHAAWQERSALMASGADENWKDCAPMSEVREIVSAEWAGWPSTDMSRDDLNFRDGQWSPAILKVAAAIYPDFAISGCLASLADAAQAQNYEDLDALLAKAAGQAGFEGEKMLASVGARQMDTPNLGDPSWSGNELAMAISAHFDQARLSKDTPQATFSSRQSPL